jgi:hypothetical protein
MTGWMTLISSALFSDCIEFCGETGCLMGNGHDLRTPPFVILFHFSWSCFGAWYQRPKGNGLDMQHHVRSLD